MSRAFNFDESHQQDPFNHHKQILGIMMMTIAQFQMRLDIRHIPIYLRLTETSSSIVAWRRWTVIEKLIRYLVCSTSILLRLLLHPPIWLKVDFRCRSCTVPVRRSTRERSGMAPTGSSGSDRSSGEDGGSTAVCDIRNFQIWEGICVGFGSRARCA